jgi:hypothetical protein
MAPSDNCSPENADLKDGDRGDLAEEEKKITQGQTKPSLMSIDLLMKRPSIFRSRPSKFRRSGNDLFVLVCLAARGMNLEAKS